MNDLDLNVLLAILLGLLIEREGGRPLTEFAKGNLLGPLQMTDTGYLPDLSQRARIAPTGLSPRRIR